MLSQAFVAHHPSMSIPPSATVDDALVVVSSPAVAEVGTWSPWPTHPVDPRIVPKDPSSPTTPAMGLVWYNTDKESIPKLMPTKMYVTEPMGIRGKEEILADIPPFRYYPPSPPPSEPRASSERSNPLRTENSSELSSFSSMHIESGDVDTESDYSDDGDSPQSPGWKFRQQGRPSSVNWEAEQRSADPEEEDTSSDDHDNPKTPSDAPRYQTMFYDSQESSDPADTSQNVTNEPDSNCSPSVRAPRIITPAGSSNPRDNKPQVAIQVPKTTARLSPKSGLSPTSSRSSSSRRAATRARIATKKVQQLESEDDIDDDSEYEQEQAEPHPVVQTIDELPSEDEHQVDDEYDELDDDTAPKKRKIKPSNKTSKKRKITERFRCTIPGCTKTFTRKNDVTRHIRASGAHPDYQEQSDNVKCTICGIDLSRSDARIRHERTYACGKRNVQQSRDKANANKNRATTA
ncbi:uncharacterized protein EV420DRAFT_167104 [Desarmillaria tabescens]|uniref:C2H2-type domain-containing protein n=1 Tax=Armillaria tabescens TaxID=1929756 RepID=A0AA39N8F9_ARMTA|nr:uncharacterized protein EV420DRAFT_167104 [Desarmillaria tabescens]KAK0460938.1 hypothetical protein EV420DRAFT_167104 [Desarmillaria tabescens]